MKRSSLPKVDGKDVIRHTWEKEHIGWNEFDAKRLAILIEYFLMWASLLRAANSHWQLC